MSAGYPSPLGTYDFEMLRLKAIGAPLFDPSFGNPTFTMNGASFWPGAWYSAKKLVIRIVSIASTSSINTLKLDVVV